MRLLRKIINKVDRWLFIRRCQQFEKWRKKQGLKKYGEDLGLR